MLIRWVGQRQMMLAEPLFRHNVNSLIECSPFYGQAIVNAWIDYVKLSSSMDFPCSEADKIMPSDLYGNKMLNKKVNKVLKESTRWCHLHGSSCIHLPLNQQLMTHKKKWHSICEKTFEQSALTTQNDHKLQVSQFHQSICVSHKRPGNNRPPS